MNRKLIVEEWLSLDGHVADKTGSLDFFVKHVRASYGMRENFLNSIDTLLFGRNTYQAFSVLWPERPVENDALAQKINTLNKVVFSTSLNKAPWGEWPEATVESHDPATALKALKAGPGKNMVLWGSISLAQTFMKAGLVDEYHLHLCPALTGGGRKFFTEELLPASLTLLESEVYDQGVLLLKYKASEL